MPSAIPLWHLDPDDPRAPSREVWEALTEDERRIVVESLPSDFPVSEANPPEGDLHYEAFSGARDTLSRWFRGRNRRVYVSGNLPVYYPGERMFSPDVIAVLDVDPHPRPSWIVSNESNRGLDFALEVVVSGRRRKDLKDNVERYARLGIREYFVFDRTRLTLRGYRIGPQERYEPLLPQGGRYASDVLELQLSVDGGKLRFSSDQAFVLGADELLAKLDNLVNDAEQRVLELEAALEEEQRRASDAQRRADDEQRRRESAEAELVALRAELEKRKG